MAKEPLTNSQAKELLAEEWNRDINYIGRLIYFLSKPCAGNADRNPNTAYTSVSSYTADDFDTTRFDHALREFECLCINVHGS